MFNTRTSMLVRVCSHSLLSVHCPYERVPVPSTETDKTCRQRMLLNTLLLTNLLLTAACSPSTDHREVVGYPSVLLHAVDVRLRSEALKLLYT